MNNKITTTTILPGIFNDIFEQHFGITPEVEIETIEDGTVYAHCDECNNITDITELYTDSGYTGRLCGRCRDKWEADDRWGEIRESDWCDYEDYKRS